MIRAQSIYNLLNKKSPELPLTGEWHEAFDRPEPTGTWFAYGGSGSGKTSFWTQLARYIDEDLNMRVAFLSMEEFGRTSLKRAIRQAGWRETGSRIQALPVASPDEVSEWLDAHNKTKVVIIDSVQYWVLKYRFTIEQYFDLKAKHSDKLFLYMSHIDGAGPDGRIAELIMRDADLKIFIQGFRAISKGRDIGPKGYYVIWPEKERIIHLSEE